MLASWLQAYTLASSGGIMTAKIAFTEAPPAHSLDSSTAALPSLLLTFAQDGSSSCQAVTFDTKF